MIKKGLINLKALIIGAGGFVGHHLINHLRDDLKWSVSATKMPNEQLSADHVAVFDLDILQKEAIKQLLQKLKPDYIFHLAAQSSVALSWKNPSLTIDVNIKGAVNLLDAVQMLDYKPRVLLIGSGEEYGHLHQGEIPVTEDNHLRPGNIYAATKVCQNMMGRIYADAYDMDVMMVRAFNHIGPGQSPIFVVADFCKQVAEIEAGKRDPIICVGNLSAKRDFTDVRDVVRAYALLIGNGVKGETYNVGSGHAIAIQDILQLLLSMSSVQISVEVEEIRFRPVDIPIIEADINKLEKCTGWRPEIQLESTITETLDFWRKTV